MGMFKEFKDFAMKGNLIDIAVGFVMGVAFKSVVTSVYRRNCFSVNWIDF